MYTSLTDKTDGERFTLKVLFRVTTKTWFVKIQRLFQLGISYAFKMIERIIKTQKSMWNL